MGLFEDTKPPEPPPQAAQKQERGIIVMFFVAVGYILMWIFKPIFVYLGTFEGRSPSQVRIQVGILVLIALSLPLLAYQIPFVRHLMISRTHTLNHSQYGGRIDFPEPQSFTPEGGRRGVSFNSRTYITYAGYTKNAMQKIDSGSCQMVTNWNRMGLASQRVPVAAEGFADEVSYVLVQNVQSLTGVDYLWERLTRPRQWFKAEELTEIMVERTKKENWKRFLDDWDLIWKFNDGYRAFEVRSLWDEHAVICF